MTFFSCVLLFKSNDGSVLLHILLTLFFYIGANVNDKSISSSYIYFVSFNSSISSSELSIKIAWSNGFVLESSSSEESIIALSDP